MGGKIVVTSEDGALSEQLAAPDEHRARQALDLHVLLTNPITIRQLFKAAECSFCHDAAPTSISINSKLSEPLCHYDYNQQRGGVQNDSRPPQFDGLFHFRKWDSASADDVALISLVRA